MGHPVAYIIKKNTYSEIHKIVEWKEDYLTDVLIFNSPGNMKHSNVSCLETHLT